MNESNTEIHSHLTTTAGYHDRQHFTVVRHRHQRRIFGGVLQVLLNLPRRHREAGDAAAHRSSSLRSPHVVLHQVPVRLLQGVDDLCRPADRRAGALDPSHAQPGDDLLHVAIPVVVGQRHRHVAFAVCLPEQCSTRSAEWHFAMLAHADDASISDGPVQETAQIIVPLWKRLPSSRLLAVGLCLLDEVARPVLGAAEQLLLPQIFL